MVMKSSITVARAAFLHPDGRLDDRPDRPTRDRKNNAISTK